MPHTSDFHRPMCFKGTFEMINGKKNLVQDFCSSKNNVKTRWPKPSEMDSGTSILQRLTEMDLHTTDLNVYLDWNTGSDLDIEVKCACGIWHGYGTSGGSEGGCYCDIC